MLLLLCQYHALAHDILTLGKQIQGVTISGGEPFVKAEELLVILRAQSELSVILLTGYAWDELPTILDKSLAFLHLTQALDHGLV